MKKKFWAILMSVALAVGLTVPAMAMDFTGSSESGDSSEITQLAFQQTSYTIAQDETFDLSKEVIAYCGTKKICQYPSLEFSTDDTNMVFNVAEDGKVDVFETSGSATVTVKEADSGKKATCRIVAKKGGEATGLKFSASSIKYVNDVAGSEQPTFMVEPTGGVMFSSAQRSAIEDAINVGFDAIGPMEFTSGTGEDQGKIIVQPKGNVSGSGSNKAYSTTVELPRSNTSNITKKTVTMRVSFVDGNEARAVARKGSIKIEVGKTVDLNDYVTYNSSANYGKKCNFSLDLYNSSASSSDYAVLGDDGHTIMGVAVGKLKAIATLDVNNAETYIPVEVVAKGNSGSTSSDTTLSISPTSGSIRVGGSLLLTAKNADSNSDISWTVDKSDIVSLADNGTKVTVKGLKVGTAKVTCEVDGEEIGTATITVSNSVADSSSDESLDGSGGTTVLPTPPIVVNPATGDSWFSYLF